MFKVGDKVRIRYNGMDDYPDTNVWTVSEDITSYVFAPDLPKYHVVNNDGVGITAYGDELISHTSHKATGYIDLFPKEGK